MEEQRPGRIKNIAVLFETQDMLVINKPAGLMVHPDGKQDKETLVDWILLEKPELSGVGEPMIIDGKEIDRPGIVHRLDEETSGVMLIAKTQEAFLFLKQQFQSHTIKKEYHAFVWGMFKEHSGIVDVPIGRNKNDFRRWHAGRGTRGEVRQAQTAWNVAGSVQDAEDRFSFMHLFPKTGRTHQLRVHMKYLQHPIVSDSLYAPTKPLVLGFNRVALHARSITFLLPKGEEKTVFAPYPADFEAAIARVEFL
jgi:23S rRNA pseudouridine1911/1915/1917 synthase